MTITRASFITPLLRATLSLLLITKTTAREIVTPKINPSTNPISRLLALKTRAGAESRLLFPNPVKWLGNMGTRAGDTGSDILAGAGAAMVAYTIATPFETVKTVNQMAGGRTRDALQSVLDRGGKRGLMRPLKAMWTAGVPYSMILYSVYRPLKAATRRAVHATREGDASEAEIFAADLLAAAGAELIGLVAYTPGELVAKRMMADPTRYPGTLAALRSIVAEKGVTGIFTGLGACLARDLPYTALQFAIFDALASRVLSSHGSDGDGTVSFGQSLAIGAGAAVVASVATLPIDAVKSQMMLASEKVSIPALVSKVVSTEGPGALFRGLPTYMTINICKWSSSQAVFNHLRGSTEGDH